MLPNQEILAQIPQQILSIPNKRKESKRAEHYCLFLLCQQAGLRVSEAINFDLSAKTHKGLYRLNKAKGRKKRYVYIPKQIINELKKHEWKPNNTNRFNFYHFLKRIKREINLPANTELTPHTLRRAFATYQAENGLPLPLLSKLLGHSSVRTTALYWRNIYNDDGDDTADILAGKAWLEKPPKPQPESAAPVKVNLDKSPELLTPNPLASEPRPDYLSEIHQLRDQLSQICQENNHLKTELSQEKEKNTHLQNDLSGLSQQNAYEANQRKQIQQKLATAEQNINQLEQKLTATENNLAQEKQISHNLRQQLQAKQETNANLTQKLHAYEQNHTNFQNAYQIALKDKEQAQKQLNQITTEIKNAARLLSQWQKLNYYQQLEKQNQMEAKILQPPPWKPGK